MGSMNSAFMHCSQKTGQQLRLKKKKKKKNADAARLSAIQTYTVFLTKIVIIFFFLGNDF